jgi:hypothetical protein
VRTRIAGDLSHATSAVDAILSATAIGYDRVDRRRVFLNCIDGRFDCGIHDAFDRIHWGDDLTGSE